MFSRWQHGWIGLDLGGSSVKAAQLSRRGGRWTLHATQVVDREAAWPTERLASDAPLRSTSELAALRVVGHFAGRLVAAVLPLAATPHVVATHAGDRDRGLAKLIAAELEHHPLAEQEALYDTWPATHPSDPPRLSPHRINALVTSTAWSDAVADDIEASGWQCQAIDGLPLAVARAVYWSAGPHRHEPIAAVDLGGTSATLVIVRDGMPLYLRSLKFAGMGPLVLNVAESLGCTLRESEQVLTSTGISTTHSGDAHELLCEIAEPTLRDLVAELQRTLQFVASSRPNLMPTRLVLLGGGASLSGLPHYLSRRIEKPVSTWHLPSFVTRGAELNAGRDARFATAIALSLLAWGADCVAPGKEVA